ncbi:hypothetical protein C1E23_01105, partial [Pseudoalteromonas phenolica]
MSKVDLKDMAALLVVILAISLFIPPIFFIWQFGFGLFPKVEQWANLGSFFSGVYAPLIGIFTLIVLFIQVRLLKNQTEIQDLQAAESITNKRIATCKTEAELYIYKIEAYLKENEDLVNTLNNAIDIKCYHDLEVLITKTHSQLYASYMQLVFNLQKLRIEGEPLYKEASQSCVYCAIASLGIKNVDTLDLAMAFIQTEGLGLISDNK